MSLESNLLKDIHSLLDEQKTINSLFMLLKIDYTDFVKQHPENKNNVGAVLGSIEKASNSFDSLINSIIYTITKIQTQQDKPQTNDELKNLANYEALT